MRTLPEDHDCKKNGCGTTDPKGDIHLTALRLCLSCCGCFDPECCGWHDESCYFASGTARQNSNTVEESPDT